MLLFLCHSVSTALAGAAGAATIQRDTFHEPIRSRHRFEIAASRGGVR
jgi:hypothetical protein